MVGLLVLAVALLVLVLSSPTLPGAGPAVPEGAPSTVVVEPGDTLWEIARRVAPERDTREVVEQIRRLNDLGPGNTTLRAGQHLVLHRG